MKCPAFDKLPPPPAGKSNWPWIEDFPSETDPTTASTGDKETKKLVANVIGNINKLVAELNTGSIT